MAVHIEGKVAYVDSFQEAMQVSVDNPEVVSVVFSKASDYFLAEKLAKAFNVK